MRLRSACVSLSGLGFVVAACAAQPGAARQCPSVAPAASVGTTPSAAPAAAPSVAGTWLFRCCDGSSQYVGMITLVQDGSTLRGAWLTDGDSHGSYVEGSFTGAQVSLTRRWQTGATAHEQHYTLTLTADGKQLDGSFTEPAFEAQAHGIQLERGFANAPRVAATATTTEPQNHPIVVKQPPWEIPDDKLDPKRPCDCKLVCYCGGIPPGPEHYAEQARCGGSCKCKVCPPLP